MWGFLREFWCAIVSCCRDCSQEHYNEGYDAYYDEKELSDNPYPDGSMASADWQFGWHKARQNSFHSVM